jgi:hypothetical protein
MCNPNISVIGQRSAEVWSPGVVPITNRRAGTLHRGIESAASMRIVELKCRMWLESQPWIRNNCVERAAIKIRSGGLGRCRGLFGAFSFT